jgi:hypothetical protein
MSPYSCRVYFKLLSRVFNSLRANFENLMRQPVVHCSARRRGGLAYGGARAAGDRADGRAFGHRPSIEGEFSGVDAAEDRATCRS